MTDNKETMCEFLALGMSEQKALETMKNPNVTRNLQLAIAESKGVKLNDGTGMLFYHLATKIKPQIMEQLPLVAKYIANGKLDSTMRIDAALEFLLNRGLNTGASVDLSEFEKECGVGVVVMPEEIDRCVQEHIKMHREALLGQRYRFNSYKIMQEVRAKLKWADAKAIKAEIDVQIFDFLGPKTEDDKKPSIKADKKGAATNKSSTTITLTTTKPDIKCNAATKMPAAYVDMETRPNADGANTIAELMKNKVHFHAPGKNYKTDGYVVTEHTERLLREHILHTSGEVRTRFPPEPNGILHIGHAKAININFGYAASQGGRCYLRYDDTNPEKEEEKFFVGIKDMVNWLGYTPYRITHSSDYFDQLYKWAVMLIKKDLAYVCHQPADEMKGFHPKPSEWRDRPIDESLQLFEDMKNGKIDEGGATLRLKLKLEEGKVDPVAYRIKFIPHHRTGNKWCIYPTYDYTHCLCDSIENITHSLCTKEFQSRRSSYYWLCNALDIYCPVQWEYGRLNMNYAVVSKRKIAKLISEGYVKDWDDPRLFTLTALRRRGFPAEAINNFCAQIGVTGAQMSVDPSMLEAAVRDILNVTAPRRLVVLEPLKVTITNFPHDAPLEVDIPNFPHNSNSDTHIMVLDHILYIEQSDFKLEPEVGYRRLTPHQAVGLRHAGLVISVSDVIKDPHTGAPMEILCECATSGSPAKPKAFIQWVSQPLEIEVRLYRQLFKHKNPEDVGEVPGGFVTDINGHSMTILQAYGGSVLKKAKVFEKFQFERVGYFSVDPDSVKLVGKSKKIIFNRTVELKEDAGKKS